MTDTLTDDALREYLEADADVRRLRHCLETGSGYIAAVNRQMNAHNALLRVFPDLLAEVKSRRWSKGGEGAYEQEVFVREFVAKRRGIADRLELPE